ncbi:MAG TPA: hypothetical protein PLB59_12440, partial [Bacteroidales bacterium]|nr:hypothetical protein [Bacteroidales bacterium]
MKRFFLVTILLGALLTSNAQNKIKPQILKGVEKMSPLKKAHGNDTDISRTNTKFMKSGAGTLQAEKKTVQNKFSPKSNGIWDVQFAHNVTIGSGIETDGSHFYVSQWNLDSIFVFNLNGTAAGKFKLPVTGIRDLAYDGTYFYGSDASNIIYKMNFNTYQIADSIVCPSYINVRHIAYDNVNNA